MSRIMGSPTLDCAVLFVVLVLGSDVCAGLRQSKAVFPPLRRSLLQDDSPAVARIFGGAPAPSGRFNYMVSLRRVGTKTHFCGGVLVRDDLVLTAAHCVDSGGASRTIAIPNPTVIIGATKINKDAGAETLECCSTIIHSKWDGRVINGYDIALLKLKGKSGKAPVTLNTAPLREGLNLAALGWGSTSADSFSTELQKAENLQVVSDDNCNNVGAWNGRVMSSMICAEGAKGVDTCDGDSGGPLIIEGGSGGDQLVGITSFGPTEGCGTPGKPGVYTQISSFLDWIESEGAGESRVVSVPFCGDPATPTDQTDKLTSLITNNKIDEAAKTVASLISGGDTEKVKDAVVKVSLSGYAELAVEALVQAVEEEGTSEEDVSAILTAATDQLPDKDSKVSSGGGGGALASENTILSLLQAGNAKGAADEIANSLNSNNADAVLQAIVQALRQDLDSIVSDALVAVIQDNGVPATQVAVALAPLCRGDQECSNFLLSLTQSG